MSDGIRDGMNFSGKGQPSEYQRPAMRRTVHDGARNLFLTERFPKVVCLCGSTKFMEEYDAAQKRETMRGRIVLSVGRFGHLDGLDMAGKDKEMLDELNIRKIDLADEVLVVSRGGYIGDSTRREIAYAHRTGKPVRWDEAERGKTGQDMSPTAEDSR